MPSRRKLATRDDTQRRVVQAISLMRQQNASLAHAARASRVSPRTVRRLAGAALRKRPNGRYGARRSDRLVRVVRLPTRDGMRDSVLRDSKQASLVAKYWNAVHAYLAKGDASGLEQFANVRIKTADGTTVLLLTDRAALDRLGGAGVLSFESIYARSV